MLETVELPNRIRDIYKQYVNSLKIFKCVLVPKLKVYSYSQETSINLISPFCRLCTRLVVSSFKETANGLECWKPTNYCHLFPRTVGLILSITYGTQTAARSWGVPGEFVKRSVGNPCAVVEGLEMCAVPLLSRPRVRNVLGCQVGGCEPRRGSPA